MAENIVFRAITAVSQATEFLSFEHIGEASAHMAISGTFVGTIDLEYSRDQTTVILVEQFTGPVTKIVDLIGTGHIRLKASAFSSGTANVSLNK